MKSLYSLFLLFVISGGLLAQPVIDQNSFISAGDVLDYIQFVEPGSELVDVIPDGGASLNWDFSALPAEGLEVSDSYYPLDSTPD
ncbi:MAG: hypothetical protein WBG42_06490, partial [Cryomorphaceae bacterium]